MFLPVLLLLPTASPLVALALQHTERVSVDSGGSQGNSDSFFPSLSGDGRFTAFESDASDLVPGDTNDRSDVFVHDRLTGQTTRVSTDSNGVQGNGDSRHPSISASGRYVAFESEASNLVPGDTNGWRDIFLHDRQTGQTTRVSVDSTGIQTDHQSEYPDISADGRIVAFESEASTLVPGDTNRSDDIFVHDRQTGQTTRVSVGSGGIQAHSHSKLPSLSDDGRHVAFVSWATNLVPGDTNFCLDIFVHDRQTGQTARTSVDSAGIQGDDHSWYPSLSAGGRYVAFSSDASNLVPGDTNNCLDVFVHDRLTRRTTRVSADSGGIQGDRDSRWPHISADGRTVAFVSRATNLVPGDTNATSDVFVHDRPTGQTTRVSVDSVGHQGNAGSYYPSISADCRYIAFESVATNLVSGDSNGRSDIFVHERMPTGPVLTVSGTCPGPMTFTLHEATPYGRVVFAYGGVGSFTLNNPPCAGTVLDLASPQFGALLRAAWNGKLQRTLPIPSGMCGLTVQALDLGTCKTSNTVVL